MKKKFLILAVETIALILISLFFVWKLYLEPGISDGSGSPEKIAGSGTVITGAVITALLIFISIQAYFFIIAPHQKAIDKMKLSVEENRKAEQIRKEFVANVSHELKTPLTSISGFIETLQAGAENDPEIRSRFIDIIAIETSRLKRLIEDLLVLSDIENKRDSENREFSVKEAVESTVETLRPIADGKDIDMILELDEEITLRGSVDRFRQMMMNLIENAIKYSNESSRIWIKAAKKEEGITVSVKDEGIGIDEEHHQRLFERFYRVDKSRSKKAGGTGLGLSIVKHIAVLFNATLKVESRLGEGSEFFVIFTDDG